MKWSKAVHCGASMSSTGRVIKPIHLAQTQLPLTSPFSSLFNQCRVEVGVYQTCL